MALEYTINDDAFEALNEDLKSEYTKSGDGYILDLSGLPQQEDVGALKRAKDRVSSDLKSALERAKSAETKLGELDASDARKSGDIDKLMKTWEGKYTELQQTTDAALSDKNKFIESVLIDNTASKIAADISTAPVVLLPHIKARLSIDHTGDTPRTKYMDKDGLETTIEKLTKEFVDNKDFAGIMAASKAKGGGAPDTKAIGSGSALPKNSDGKPIALSEATPAELAAMISSRKK